MTAVTPINKNSNLEEIIEIPYEIKAKTEEVIKTVEKYPERLENRRRFLDNIMTEQRKKYLGFVNDSTELHADTTYKILIAAKETYIELVKLIAEEKKILDEQKAAENKTIVDMSGQPVGTKERDKKLTDIKAKETEVTDGFYNKFKEMFSDFEKRYSVLEINLLAQNRNDNTVSPVISEQEIIKYKNELIETSKALIGGKVENIIIDKKQIKNTLSEYLQPALTNNMIEIVKGNGGGSRDDLCRINKYLANISPLLVQRELEEYMKIYSKNKEERVPDLNALRENLADLLVLTQAYAHFRDSDSEKGKKFQIAANKKYQEYNNMKALAKLNLGETIPVNDDKLNVTDMYNWPKKARDSFLVLFEKSMPETTEILREKIIDARMKGYYAANDYVLIAVDGTDEAKKTVIEEIKQDHSFNKFYEKLCSLVINADSVIEEERKRIMLSDMKSIAKSYGCHTFNETYSNMLGSLVKEKPWIALFFDNKGNCYKTSARCAAKLEDIFESMEKTPEQKETEAIKEEI